MRIVCYLFQEDSAQPTKLQPFAFPPSNQAAVHVANLYCNGEASKFRCLASPGQTYFPPIPLQNVQRANCLDLSCLQHDRLK